MADIFISYSKKHAALTEELARDLEAEGYTTWWDTNLLPDDGFFPETIRAEIAAAKAVIVIWAEHSVTSRWVYSEASEGDAHGKLLQVRDEALDPRKVPMPFTSGNITLVKDRAKIFAALARRGCNIAPKQDQRKRQRADGCRARRLWRGRAGQVAISGADGRPCAPQGQLVEARARVSAISTRAPEMVVVPAGSLHDGIEGRRRRTMTSARATRSRSAKPSRLANIR